jgi:thioredoxin 1
MVKAITTKEEFDTLVSVLYLSEESALTRCQINSGDVVVVDFWATWCGPCKLISPHFTKLEEKFPAVKFAKVDVEEVEDVAKDQEIRAMPTFKAYKNGKPIDQITGAVPAKLTVSGPVVLSRRKTHADDNVRLFNNRSCPLYPPYSPDSHALPPRARRLPLLPLHPILVLSPTRRSTPFRPCSRRSPPPRCAARRGLKCIV